MTIDLNADVGEGAGGDAELIPLVTSVNVSGGAHAGDRDTIARAVALAVEHGVAIGAHPGYPDREHAGRRAFAISDVALASSIAEQLAAVAELAQAAGGRVAYVKPHGALYHAVAADPRLAALVDQAIASVDPRWPVLLAPGAAHARLAAARGVRVYAEGFADRAYAPPSAVGQPITLVPRGEAGAMLGPRAAAEQARALVVHGSVIDLAGTDHPLVVDSICLHGDGPAPAQTAVAIRRALAAAGAGLAPFVTDRSQSGQ